MSKYQQNDEPSRKITEYERGILYAFYGPVPATSNDEAILLKVKNAVEAAEPELIRLRAENEKLRAAVTELTEENRLVGLQMDRMADEIEKLRAILSNVKLSIEAFDPAAALKETGDE